jgi:hypothetical protein
MRRPLRAPLLVTVPLLLATACAPRMMWTKENWNEQEARRDFYEWRFL